MTHPSASQLLRVWERGALERSSVRALLLLVSTGAARDAEHAMALGIGERDAQLLALHERLFGRDIQAQARCKACAAPFELAIDARAIRVSYDRAGATHTFEERGYRLRFRSVSSADLLAIERERTPAEAVASLVSRCVLDAEHEGQRVEVKQLPAELIEALAVHMAEVDPQAEVAFELQCPECEKRQSYPFDIVEHLWAKLDRWARGLLRDVHILALAYGWSERSLIQMSAARRGVYLALLGAR